MATDSTSATLRRRVIIGIVTPVVRFCLKYSISLSEFIEAAKQVFVSLAATEIQSKGERVTVSRISVLTGLNRRDAQRLIGQSEPKVVVPGLMARVLTAWEKSPKYCVKSGVPKPLTYDGPKPNFQTLVSSISKDVGPAAVCKELIRMGAVEKDKKGNLRLTSSTVRYNELPEKGLNLLARDFESLGAAVQENLDDPEKPVRNLHSRTEFDNIFMHELPQIRAWLLKEGTLFHKRARDYLSEFDKDFNPESAEKGGGKVVIGSFSLTLPSVENITPKSEDSNTTK